jgi:hypothetical protein
MMTPVLSCTFFALLIGGLPLPQNSAAVDPQPPKQTTEPAPAVNADELPVSIEHIQRALNRPPAIRISEQRTIFRVEVFGNKPTIEEILGRDYLKGPTPAPAGGMTHQEFLNLVTPEEFRGYASYTNKEGLQIAATSFATAIAMQAVQSAWKRLQAARKEQEREAARREVEQALEALRKARRDAGLERNPDPNPNPN